MRDCWYPTLPYQQDCRARRPCGRALTAVTSQSLSNAGGIVSRQTCRFFLDTAHHSMTEQAGPEHVGGRAHRMLLRRLALGARQRRRRAPTATTARRATRATARAQPREVRAAPAHASVASPATGAGPGCCLPCLWQCTDTVQFIVAMNRPPAQQMVVCQQKPERCCRAGGTAGTPCEIVMSTRSHAQ